MKTKKNKPQRAIDTIRLTLNSAATALNTDRRTLQKRLQAIGVDCGRGKSFTVQEATTKIVKLSADPLPVYKIPFQPASISFTIKAPDPLDNNL